MLTKDEIRDNFLAAWNRGDFANLRRTYAKDHRIHDTSGIPSGSNFDGLEQTIRTYRKAFPNLQMRVTHLVREGDQVAMRWHCKGRHTGDLLGMKPTQKEVEVSGTSFLRYVDDKLVEEYDNWDALSFLQQVGAVPEMKAPAQV